MRVFHRARHLRVTQLLHPVVANRVHHAAGCHQLDPVSAKFDIATDNAAHIVDRVYLVGLLQRRLVWRETIRITVTTGERYTTARRDNARAGNELLLNPFAQGKLRIRRIGLRRSSLRARALSLRAVAYRSPEATAILIVFPRTSPLCASPTR